MCLVLFSWKAHPRYELVLAANRDEFHERPTAPAAFWADDGRILAGRDLQAGGTWMGVCRPARFAAVTNYREPRAPAPENERSRGHLVHRYLSEGDPPLDAARRIHHDVDGYRGFNLLLGKPGELVYVSNRNGAPAAVTPGVHGLSNHLLDTGWPKVVTGRNRLAAILECGDVDTAALFDLMADASPVDGMPPENVEPALSPEALTRRNFIRSPVYGTRSSTVLLMDYDGRLTFEERTFAPSGRCSGTSRFELDAPQDMAIEK